MKKTLQFLLIAIAIGTFVSSCTTEKRLYMPGYNVEWKKSNISSNKADANNENAILFKFNKIKQRNTSFIKNNELSTGDSKIYIDTDLIASTDNSNILYPPKIAHELLIEPIIKKGNSLAFKRNPVNESKTFSERSDRTEKRNNVNNKKDLFLFSNFRKIIIGALISFLGIFLLLKNIINRVYKKKPVDLSRRPGCRAIGVAILLGLIGWACYAGGAFTAASVFFTLATIAFLVGFIVWLVHL